MGQQDPPKVSVIIPCFNLGEYIEETVDSVFAQTCQDFEILIVNDGSTDPASNALLSQFRRPRTKVLTTANQGLPAARNHAIAQARGRYICALDADDKLHPMFLEKTTAVLDTDPEIAFVSTWLETFGTEHWTWRQDRCDFPTLLGECVVLTAAPVRREAIDAVGGYDSGLFSDGEEDWDLWISLVEKGFRGTILPEVLFYYRRRPGSMMSVCTRGETRMRLFNNLLEKHQASYLRHLPDVLLHREAECGRMLRDNWLLERELAVSLGPQVADARAELASLESRLEKLASVERSLAAAHDETAALRKWAEEIEAALHAALGEIAALHDSRSWRVTAPLRRGQDLLRTLRKLLSDASKLAGTQ